MNITDRNIAADPGWAQPSGLASRPRALVIGCFPPEPGRAAACSAVAVMTLAERGHEVLTISVSGRGDAHRVLDFSKWVDLVQLLRELKGRRFDVVVIDPTAFGIRRPRSLVQLSVVPGQLLMLFRLAWIGRRLLLFRGKVRGWTPARPLAQFALSHRLGPRLPLRGRLSALRKAIAAELATGRFSLLGALPSRRKGGRPERGAFGAEISHSTARIAPVDSPRAAATLVSEAAWRLRDSGLPLDRLRALHDSKWQDGALGGVLSWKGRIDAADEADPNWSVSGHSVTRLMVHMRHTLRAKRRLEPGTRSAARSLIIWYNATMRRMAGSGIPLPRPVSETGPLTGRDAAAARRLAGWWADLALNRGLHAPLARPAQPDEQRVLALTAAVRCVIDAVIQGTELPAFSPDVERVLAAPVMPDKTALSGLEFALGLLAGPIDETPEAGAGWHSPQARAFFAALVKRTPGLGRFSSSSPEARPELSLIGHVDAQTGLSANLAMTRHALEAAGLSPVTRGLNLGLARTVPELVEPGQGFVLDRPVRLLHLNADAIPQTLVQPVMAERRDAINVGFLLWEFGVLPDAHRLALDMLDEAWCPTEFVSAAYRASGRLPVHTVGKAVTLGQVDPAGRADFGLPEDVFLFCVTFDFHSSVERKNPLAAVEAFRNAFPSGRRDVGLVVKTTEIVRGHWGDPCDQWSRITEHAASDSRICIVRGRISAPRYMALLKACDCLVSPHRAEGFGYAPAHCMLMKRPVIVTDYSGTADFCTPETSFPVPYTLRPVREREAIYPVPGAQWAEIDRDALAETMREVADNPGTAAARAAAGQALMERDYSVAAQSRRYLDRLEALGVLVRRA